MYDLIIENARVVDGSGAPETRQNVAISSNKIVAVGTTEQARQRVDATGLVLCPGFIDVHTHDDLHVIRQPEAIEKISQGITTVIVGNCGICAAPAFFGEDSLRQELPDPMNLLGKVEEFRYRSLPEYMQAVQLAKPFVNVGALIGHTALRSNSVQKLGRTANNLELEEMKQQLREAMEAGALGLSTGLAYYNAFNATPAEVEALVEVVAEYNGVYTTHLRTEFEGILDAMDEAFSAAGKHSVPLVISHLKCAGKANWGRGPQLTQHIEQAGKQQKISCDCYPYSASSSTLDLGQVTEETEIFITWSDARPEAAGKTLKQIAQEWNLSLLNAAKQLMPAGAVYYCMDEQDVERILQYEKTMLGSDGLPCDPHPHPRLWGSFPRMIAHYSQTKGLFSLEQAIHKMTGLSAKNFNLQQRGLIRPDYYADLLLFDPDKIKDTATFEQPINKAAGIECVWVNGSCSYLSEKFERSLSVVPHGAGQFLTRNNDLTS